MRTVSELCSLFDELSEHEQISAARLRPDHRSVGLAPSRSAPEPVIKGALRAPQQPRCLGFGERLALKNVGNHTCSLASRRIVLPDRQCAPRDQALVSRLTPVEGSPAITLTIGGMKLMDPAKNVMINDSEGPFNEVAIPAWSLGATATNQ